MLHYGVLSSLTVAYPLNLVLKINNTYDPYYTISLRYCKRDSNKLLLLLNYYYYSWIYFRKLMTMGIKKPKLIHQMAMPLTVQVMVHDSSYALVYSVLIFLLLLRFQKAKARSPNQLQGSNLNWVELNQMSQQSCQHKHRIWQYLDLHLVPQTQTLLYNHLDSSHQEGRGKGPQATNQGAQMLDIGIVRIECRQLKSPRNPNEVTSIYVGRRCCSIEFSVAIT